MTETSASLTETNREIIRRTFDAWSQGTGYVSEVFAPGMVWRIVGYSAASKEYGSKQVVDGTAFYDSISFNDLWSRVQPR